VIVRIDTRLLPWFDAVLRRNVERASVEEDRTRRRKKYHSRESSSLSASTSLRCKRATKAARGATGIKGGEEHPLPIGLNKASSPKKGEQ